MPGRLILLIMMTLRCVLLKSVFVCPKGVNHLANLVLAQIETIVTLTPPALLPERGVVTPPEPVTRAVVVLAGCECGPPPLVGNRSLGGYGLTRLTRLTLLTKGWLRCGQYLIGWCGQHCARIAIRPRSLWNCLTLNAWLRCAYGRRLAHTPRLPKFPCQTKTSVLILLRFSRRLWHGASLAPIQVNSLGLRACPLPYVRRFAYTFLARRVRASVMFLSSV